MSVKTSRFRIINAFTSTASVINTPKKLDLSFLPFELIDWITCRNKCRLFFAFFFFFCEPFAPCLLRPVPTSSAWLASAGLYQSSGYWLQNQFNESDISTPSRCDPPKGQAAIVGPRMWLVDRVCRQFRQTSAFLLHLKKMESVYGESGR